MQAIELRDSFWLTDADGAGYYYAASQTGVTQAPLNGHKCGYTGVRKLHPW